MELVYTQFIKALDPETDTNDLLSLLSTDSKPILWALCTQKKLSPRLFKNPDPLMKSIIELRQNQKEKALILLAENLPQGFLMPLFISFTHSEPITNYFIKKDICFFKTYVNSLFKKDKKKEDILSDYERFKISKNPQKKILSILIEKQNYLSIIGQKKIPAWVLDVVTENVIESNYSPKTKLNVDLPNFINNYLIDNRNLSVNSAIKLFEAFPEKCEYGKAFKIKHRVVLKYVQETFNYTSLYKNQKLKDKTFYALWDLAKNETNFAQKKALYGVLIHNPLCPPEILKSVLMSSSLKTMDYFEVISKLPHLQKEEFISLIFSHCAKNHWSLFFSWNLNLPLAVAKEQRKFLKDKRAKILSEPTVSLEEIKAIDAKLEIINSQLKSSSNSKIRLSAIF